MLAIVLVIEGEKIEHDYDCEHEHESGGRAAAIVG